MTYLVLDVETTIRNNGNPYDPFNRLMSVQLFPEGAEHGVIYDIEHGLQPFAKHLETIRRAVESADYLVGFNIKFDVAWLRRYIPGIRISRVWDLQLWEFLCSGQTMRMPALADVLEMRGMESKGDLASEYWDKGIDTPMIPWETLATYGLQDIEVEHQLFKYQREATPPDLMMLFKLQCEDLLILQEMEQNGLPYSIREAEEQAAQTAAAIESIDVDLRHIVSARTGGCDHLVNLGSSQHLSALLYGGTITYEGTEEVEKPRKDGSIRKYTRKCDAYLELKGFFRPDKKEELVRTRNLSDEDLHLVNKERQAKGQPLLFRYYSTGESVIKRLGSQRASKMATQFVGLLQERAKLAKLQSTYYQGMIDLMKSFGWDRDGIIHSTLNQTVAQTGRLSSSNPNQQNMAKDVKVLVKSRFNGELLA